MEEMDFVGEPSKIVLLHGNNGQTPMNRPAILFITINRSYTFTEELDELLLLNHFPESKEEVNEARYIA